MDGSGKGMPVKPLPELIKNITELLDPENILRYVKMFLNENFGYGLDYKRDIKLAFRMTSFA